MHLLMTNSMPPSNERHSSELDTLPDAASPTTSGAAHRLFSTTELLCSIVAHLPPKDILTTGAVCRDWRAALAADPTIQEALFLKPREICEVFAHDLDILDPQIPVSIQECTIIGDVNPWISEIFGPVYGLFSVYPFISAEFQSRGGLWREMFVTQPPCKAANVSTLSSFLLDQDIVFKREADIKMGELYDFIEEEIRDCPDRRETLNARDFYSEEFRRLPPHATTRCMVRDGGVCRPAQLPERRSHSGSEHSQDPRSNDNNGELQGVLGNEDRESESEA